MTFPTWSRFGLVILLFGTSSCVDNGTKSKGSVLDNKQSDTNKQTKGVFQGPSGLICAAIDGGGVHLSWSNRAAYDEIQVSRDGVWIATLPGDATSYTDPDPPEDVCRYRVNGVGQEQSASSSCELSLRPVPPVEALVCSAIGLRVTLQWRNPEEYAAIEIRRNGERVAILGVGESSWAEEAPAGGTVAYAVRGLDISGAASPPVECVLAVSPPSAPPIEDLVCGPDGVRILLSWRPPRAGSYTSIRVLRNGGLLAELGPTDSFYADTVPEAGSYAYVVEGRREGYETAAAGCTVRVEGIAPVEDLACAVQDYDVFLSWSLPQGTPYAAIEVYRDGVLAAALPAAATSWSETAPSAGAHLYGVRGIAPPLAPSALETCSVTVLSLPPVADLACALSGTEARLSWGIPEGTSYTTVLIRRNGSQRASLDGAATAFSEALPAEGRYAYEVIGRRDGVPDAESARCEVVLLPLAPVRDLAVDRTGTTVDLRWTAGAGYDAILVLRGGAVVAELGGSETSYRDTLPGAGLYRYAVIPRSGGRQAQAVACDVAAGRLRWLPNEESDLAGYRLYCARQSGAYGEKDDPSLELGFQTAIPLEELLERRVIGSGSNFIVLAAVDTSGNVSEFSEEVAFEYHVEIGTGLP